MLPGLRQPKWIIAGAIVVILAAVFVRLGFWQLSRLEERRLENTMAQTRLQTDPVPFDQLVAQAGGDPASIEYRRATVSGRWDPTEEVLIRSQVELGNAGFHVITPLVTDNNNAVLVNRGWVPLAMDDPPIEEASPTPGVVEVEGWVHLTQPRPPLGAEEPAGDLNVLNRVDIARIDSQMAYDLASVYLIAAGEEDQLPIPVDPPDFTNEGPHLAYAIQWFGFALVGVVGFFFLARRKGGQSR